MSQPIPSTEFACLLSDVFAPRARPSSPCAVAFSGGIDSLALLLLLKRADAFPLISVTVDHLLRPESSAQAAACAQIAQDLDVRHVILRWQGPKPISNKQARAREARYALLEDYCAENALSHLFLGHHLQDQAETFLLRMMRCSGVDGLACMTKLSHTRGGLALARPLLTTSKQRLEATLEAHGLQSRVLHDPSNDDDAYTRVRVRKLLPILEQLGLGASHLAGMSTCMQSAKVALEKNVDTFVETHLQPASGGFSFARKAWLREEGEIRQRILTRLLCCLGKCGTKPKFSSLQRLLQALPLATFKRATLHGCVISIRGGQITISPEARVASIDPSVLE